MVTPAEQMFSAPVPLGEVLLFPMGGGALCPEPHPLTPSPQEASYLGGASMCSQCSLLASASR